PLDAELPAFRVLRLRQAHHRGRDHRLHRLAGGDLDRVPAAPAVPPVGRAGDARALAARSLDTGSRGAHPRRGSLDAHASRHRLRHLSGARAPGARGPRAHPVPERRARRVGDGAEAQMWMEPSSPRMPPRPERGHAPARALRLARASSPVSSGREHPGATTNRVPNSFTRASMCALAAASAGPERSSRMPPMTNLPPRSRAPSTRVTELSTSLQPTTWTG